jgi:hypothetical protein
VSASISAVRTACGRSSSLPMGSLLLVLWCFDSLFILSRWATAEALWHFSKCRVYAPVFGIENCCT